MWQCNAEPPLLDVFLPGCPRDVAAVVSQALRKNPDERFASMTAFAAALRSAFQSYLAAKARGGTAKLEVGGPMTESDLDAILRSPGSEGSWSNLIANARHATSGAVLAKATTGTGTQMMEGTEDKLEVVAHLVMQIGPSPGHRYALTRGTYVVGRDRDVDLYINDPSLSAHHAKIVVHPTGIVEVTDDSSTNGTFVDDVRVPFAVPKHGARLRFGTVSLDVAYVDKLRRLSAVEGTVRVESSSGASGVVPIVRPALATRESPVARSPAAGVPVTQALEPVSPPVLATVPMPVRGAPPALTAPAYLSSATHIPAPPVVSSNARQKQSTLVAIIVGCSVGVLVITLVYFLLQSGRL
jgi:pSer/pThr/pTyr-binding forkhead associated (FHA) protein